MENNRIYESPDAMVIDIDTEGVICMSGDIEPITEEDW